MSDNSELKRLVDLVLKDRRFCGDENHKALADGVLALTGENDALSGLLKRFVDGEHEQDENQAERHMYFTEAQSLLALVSGELEAHTIVPDSAIKAAHSERDQLRAEVAGLRTGYEAYEQVNADLKAECEALRKDAERYRWLASKAELESYGGSEYCLPLVNAWDYKPGPQLNEQFENLDAAIDAAMGKGEQS